VVGPYYGAREMSTNRNMARYIEGDGEYRILATFIPANNCYAERLLVIAMPDATDARVEIVGQLTVYAERLPIGGDAIDWIEVHPAHRRKGIGRRLWHAAEKVLGRTLDHDPVTDEGEAFAEAMERAAAK
jgi:GNAT superfamily N-acetyltransferase